MRKPDAVEVGNSANQRWGLRTLALAAALALAACTSRTGNTSAQPQGLPRSASTESTSTTANVPTSTTTTICIKRPAANPAIDVATHAAEASVITRNYELAERLVDTIDDAKLRDQAEHAVDLGEAEQTAWLALNDDNFSQANVMLALVEAPDLHALAATAIADAQNEYELWNRKPLDTATWYKAETQATNDWYNLRIQATSAWYGLDQQSSDFCHAQ